MAVSRRRLLHHGILAAAACWAKPLFAQERHRLLDGNGNNIGNDDTATLPRPALPGASDNWEDHASALAGITRQQFAGAVGTDFKIVFPDGTTAPVWLTLAAVNDLPSAAVINPASFAVAMPRSSSVAPATSGYSMTFLSTAELTQGAYLFDHATLGKFALFMVPDGATGYSAVINRLSGPTIIAVPFQTGVGRNVMGSGNTGGTTIKINAPAAAVTASPATSSETDSPSPRLYGNQGVRRGLLSD